MRSRTVPPSTVVRSRTETTVPTGTWPTTALFRAAPRLTSAAVTTRYCEGSIAAAAAGAAAAAAAGAAAGAAAAAAAAAAGLGGGGGRPDGHERRLAAVRVQAVTKASWGRAA